jgi:transposase
VSLPLARGASCDRVGVELTEEQVAELRAVAASRDVSGAVATRARIVLWTAEGRMRKDVGELAGVSLPTVDRWVERYAAHGLAGLEEHKRGAPRGQVPVQIPARILALTRTTPPTATGLSHWSSREMAAYIARTEGVSVSWHYVAKLWRDNGLKPHRPGCRW